jgi:hypothetical protein
VSPDRPDKTDRQYLSELVGARQHDLSNGRTRQRHRDRRRELTRRLARLTTFDTWLEQTISEDYVGPVEKRLQGERKRFVTALRKAWSTSQSVYPDYPAHRPQNASQQQAARAALAYLRRRDGLTLDQAARQLAKWLYKVSGTVAIGRGPLLRPATPAAIIKSYTDTIRLASATNARKHVR